MTSVMFAWELGAGQGHWTNLAPLVTHFAEAGHEIWFASRDVAIASRLDASNANLTMLQAPRLDTPVHLRLAARCLPEVLHNVGYHDADVLASGISAWQNLFSLIKPDILVCEHSPTALLASRESDTKSITLGPGFSCPPAITPSPGLVPWVTSAPTHQELITAEQSILATINAALDVNQLPTLARFSDLYSDVDGTFLIAFPELDPYGPRPDVTYWGMWSAHRTLSASWPNPSSAQRVFLYLQDTPWIAELLHQLSQAGCSVVAVIRNCERGKYDSLNSHQIAISYEPICIQHLIKDCTLAIHNGSIGTVTTFLLAGVPSLCIPTHLEQTLNSHSAHQLGAALWHVGNDFSPISEQLDYMLSNTQFRNAAEAFAARYSSYDSDTALQGIVHKMSQLMD